MDTYKMLVTYAGVETPQEARGLKAAEALTGATAFLRDMLTLENSGVVRVEVAVEELEAA